MKPRVIPHRRIPTKGPAGEVNGWLVPIFNLDEHPVSFDDYVFTWSDRSSVSRSER